MRRSARPLSGCAHLGLKLSAIPVADLDRKTERIVLEGDVPSPVDPPSGCPFHPRCRHATDVCRTEVPQLRPFGDGTHVAACHRVEELTPPPQ